MKQLALLTLVLAATPAFASADRTPQPGGVYRLKPGIYAEKGQACATAPFAAIREYDGIGISTPHTRTCRARVLSRRGKTYRVTQTCLDAGSGPAKPFTQRQTVVVDDAIDFRQTIAGATTRYRYCPASELSPDMRKDVYYPK